MITNQIATRGLAVLVASALLGSVTARADQHEDPSLKRPAEASSQTEKEPTEVGDPASNVDKDSSSGAYYPYSAGTVGDDPADPTSTWVPPDAGDNTSEPTDQWGTSDTDGDGYLSRAELTKTAPELTASFDAMDVDGDGKLTRGEFRSWHESRKARVDTDGDTARPTSDPRTPTTPTPPNDDGTN